MEAAEAWESSLSQVEDLIFKLKSPWNTSATLSERKTTLHEEANSIRKGTIASQSQISNYISEIQLNITASRTAARETLRLAVEMDPNGNIVQLSRIGDEVGIKSRVIMAPFGTGHCSKQGT